MKVLARILIMLLTLFFLGTGLNMLFNPASIAERASLSITGPMGFSTIRGAMGASYIMIGVFLGASAWRIQKDSLLVPGIFLCILLFARLLSVAIDGSTQEAILAIVVETVFLIIVIFGYRTFQKSMNKISFE